ncbi:oxygenase MpaB family protein [Tsukamurella sp. 8F]|uniref:oxygenase MpaB family protein n=1 Tax=unclassified Tsukamurella TaxID=2633480 RepID=UPI0023BA3CD8|nr:MULTISPECIES: oxygenase MpaB family protein [unclassified Tsukamurella]MDF0531561.1 oxygenase MpaB family protein [Tsukamurella sp. 8J]MDF0588827.1 oxygenase MpaB family protein [Tsukamurella sp. 8F]
MRAPTEALAPAQAVGCRIVIDAPMRPRRVRARLPHSAEPLSTLAGPANVVMQLLWPGVGYGVMESRVHSGSLYRHPVKRTRTTFAYLAVVMFGSDADRARYRESVNGQHRQVFSDRTSKSPVDYHAMDPRLQLWVAMCLYVGFEDTHELLHGRMSDEQKELFYRGSAALGTTLQVRSGMWPVTRAAFEDQWIEMCARAHATDAIREYLLRLVDLEFLGNTILLAPIRPLARFMTSGFLAPVFREQMGIVWTDSQQRRFDAVMRTASIAQRLIPRPIGTLPYRMLVWDLRLRHRLGRPSV